MRAPGSRMRPTIDSRKGTGGDLYPIAWTHATFAGVRGRSGCYSGRRREAFLCGFTPSRRPERRVQTRWSGAVPETRRRPPWMPRRWWGAHTGVRLVGSSLPPWERKTRWWFWAEGREQPGVVQKPPFRLRTGGGGRRPQSSGPQVLTKWHASRTAHSLGPAPRKTFTAAQRGAPSSPATPPRPPASTPPRPPPRPPPAP